MADNQVESVTHRVTSFLKKVAAFLGGDANAIPEPPYPLSTWDELPKEDWPADYVPERGKKPRS
jgi:hypothetical protein